MTSPRQLSAEYNLSVYIHLSNSEQRYLNWRKSSWLSSVQFLNLAHQFGWTSDQLQTKQTISKWNSIIINIHSPFLNYPKTKFRWQHLVVQSFVYDWLIRGLSNAHITEEVHNNNNNNNNNDLGLQGRESMANFNIPIRRGAMGG